MKRVSLWMRVRLLLLTSWKKVAIREDLYCQVSKRCFRPIDAISPVLETQLNETISLEQLPVTTKDGISYGIIASIKALIDKHSDGKKLYFTGGDGKFLSGFFAEAIYDEMLVFDGMRKVIKESERC